VLILEPKDKLTKCPLPVILDALYAFFLVSRHSMLLDVTLDGVQLPFLCSLVIHPWWRNSFYMARNAQILTRVARGLGPVALLAAETACPTAVMATCHDPWLRVNTESLMLQHA
jgi:hypothetical protein